jgi:hypothetical protein
MKWFWYVATDRELMMDCDGRTLLEIAMKRLERDAKFDYDKIFSAPSQSPDHWHLVVRLEEPMEIMRRMVWQLYLMDHVYRSCKNIFRVLDDVPSPSLLISPKPWKNFWRKPDASCECESHKNHLKIWDCPAHERLRGEPKKEAWMSL